jgi:DNA invertase Pin-like site-specific DNA recombinase
MNSSSQPTGNNLAISSLRWSTKEQRLGDSERRQLAETRSFCERHGLNLDESRTVLDPGVSGFRGKNRRKGHLAKFLEEVKAGRIPRGTTLVIETLDRLSRDELEQADELIRGLIKSGIRIGNVRRDKILDKSSLRKITDVIEFNLELRLAGEESAKKSARNSADWCTKRTKMAAGVAVTKVCPFWLDVVGERKSLDRRFVVRPDMVEVIKRIFDEALNGKGSPRIAKTLNLVGIRNHRGKPWTFQAVTDLLRDRRVLGEIELIDGSVLPAYYPQVIDAALFGRVQLARQQRSTKPGRMGYRGRPENHINLFRDIMWDARTGSPVSGVTFNKPGAFRFKLVPKRYSNAGLGHRQAFVYEYFEQAFLAFVRELKPADFVGNGAVDPAVEVAELSARLTQVNDQLDKTQDRINRADDQQLEVLMPRFNFLKLERDKIKAEYDAASLRAANPVVEVAGDLHSLVGLLATADDPADLKLKIRARIRQLVEGIWLFVWDSCGVRTGLAQVFFPDGSCREFFACYSLSQRPLAKIADSLPEGFQGLKGSTQAQLGTETRYQPPVDLRNLRDRIPSDWSPKSPGFAGFFLGLASSDPRDQPGYKPFLTQATTSECLGFRCI